MNRGFFITFEGTEGSGKSTQIKMLCKKLEQDGLEVVLTREPGGCELAEGVRELLLGGRSEISPLAELLLFEGARAQHVSEVILPALEKDKIVICDRFIHSTIAYQGYARGLNIGLVQSLNEIAVQGCQPDMTIFLHIEPGLSFERKGGMDEDDRMEMQGMDFHQAVYRGFEEIAGQNKNFIMLDVAGNTKYETSEIVYRFVKDKLRKGR